MNQSQLFFEKSDFCCFYVVERLGGDVKIGRSINPNKRVRDIQTQGGFEATRKFISQPMLCCGMVENFMHRFFSGNKIIGEWFNASFDVVCKAFDDEVWNTDEYKKAVGSLLITASNRKEDTKQFFNFLLNDGLAEDTEVTDVCDTRIDDGVSAICRSIAYRWAVKGLEEFAMSDDDLLNDVENKSTLIGAMQGIMIANEFPTLKSSFVEMLKKGFSFNDIIPLLEDEYKIKPNPLTSLVNLF